MNGPETTTRSVAAVTRRLLLAYCALGFFAGVPLFIGTGETDRYFAWTIMPSLTAAFLGAGYWASCVLNLLAARKRAWAGARIAVPAGLVFTTVMLVATLLHLDRFHFGGPLSVAQSVAWIWLVVYVAIPPLTLIVFLRQTRAPGRDEFRGPPLPRAVRFVLACQGVVMTGVGTALLLAPEATASIWPWTLTELTGRAAAAWLAGVGVLAMQISWENDISRASVAFVPYTLLAGLQFVALARYPSTVDWSGASAWIYLLFLGSMFAAGAYAWSSGRRASTSSKVFGR